MIKILVVEDERAISDLIRMNLEDAGYACTCAYDGMAAADQIETQTFDLVLLDIMLPKVNGYELLEYIKPTGTPVIFLTAKAGLDDRVKGLNLGAEDYIVKPFEIVELIAQRRSNREIAEKLYLSEGSIRQYVNQIYTKLQIAGEPRAKRKLLLDLLADKN